MFFFALCMERFTCFSSDLNFIPSIAPATIPKPMPGSNKFFKMSTPLTQVRNRSPHSYCTPFLQKIDC